MKRNMMYLSMIGTAVVSLSMPAAAQQQSSQNWRNSIRVAASASQPQTAPPAAVRRSASTTVTPAPAAPRAAVRIRSTQNHRTAPRLVHPNLFVGGELARLRHRPVVIGGRTYVPLRDFVSYINRRFDAGLDVEWAGGDVILRESQRRQVARRTSIAGSTSPMAQALLDLWRGDITTAAANARAAADAGDPEAADLLAWIADAGGADGAGVVRVSNVSGRSDITVYVDGEPVDTDGMVALVKSGAHTVQLSSNGRMGAARTVQIDPGKAFVIRVAEG